MLLRILFITLLSFSAKAETNIQVESNSITIIGETHGRPESIQLFQSLIKGYLANNKCLTVALEINSKQLLK